MHELSIALSLVELAREESLKHGGQVTAVHIKVGRLSGVVSEALMSCYAMASADTPLDGSRLVIEDVPIIVFCARCESQFEPVGDIWFACPDCGESTPDVRQGRELQLVALEIEE